MATPENTPMKKQWIKIDGRSTPVFLPQYWDENLQDWVVSSESNRLPVDAQLTGRNVEQLTPVPSLAITDTIRHYSGFINLSKYKKLTFFVNSSLDANIKLGFTRGGEGDWIAVHDGTDFQRLAPPDNQLVISSGNSCLLNTKLDFLNHPLYSLNIAMECETAPTSGSVTIIIWGVLN